MTDQDKIDQILADSWCLYASGPMDDCLGDCAICRKQALSTAGVVRMAEDQELPEIPRKEIAHIVAERDRLLLEAGWRKVVPLTEEE